MTEGGGRRSIQLLAPFDPLYGSFWIDGLRHFGEIELCPLPAPLPPSCLAFEFVGRKFMIDAGDKPFVNKWWQKWSDVYGKINLPFDTDVDNVVPIGPGFATRTWGIVPMTVAFLRSARWAKQRNVSYTEYAGGFVRQWYRRLPLDALVPGPSDPNYIFALHSFWPTEPVVNELRARFMRVARSWDGLQFEGGFLPSRHGQALGYDDLLSSRLAYREWIRLTQRSAVVLNTSAVHGCLGWKLGEYLALGKAIISTPIPHQLPAELEHGTHLHVIEGSETSMRTAIERLVGDHAYRLHLETNARAYFDQFLSPPAAVERLVSHDS